MTFIPSSEQSRIFSHVEQGLSNLIVSACPGSGKTTTSMHAMGFCRKSSGFIPTSILYLAFAKANVEEAKARAPQGVTVSTFHSLGLRALKAAGFSPTIAGTFDFKTKKKTPPKVGKLVWDVMGSTDPEAANVIRLVGLLKSGCAADMGIAASLCDIHNIELSPKNISLALRVLEKSDADLSSVDFDDMLRLPVLLSLPFAPWDYVFVDEAQDTNEVQAEILARLQHKIPESAYIAQSDEWCKYYNDEIKSGPAAPKSKTLFVIVGDPYQSIYGFRGASTSAMDTLKSKFVCSSLSLSLSFRCPKAVVAEAQRILSLTL